MKPTPTVWEFRLRDALVHRASILPDFRNWQTDTVFFTDEKDRLRMSIQIDGTITIEPGYAWDGCSPKWRLGPYLWGTPDGAPNPDTGYPYTYFASCIHDALCQWEDDKNMPYTREQIDQIFLARMQADSFPLALVYYRAVRIYSRLTGFWRSLPRIAL